MPSTCAAQPNVFANVTVDVAGSCLEALVEHRQLALALELRDLRVQAAGAIISKIFEM
jgi:hypothetical protein